MNTKLNWLLKVPAMLLLYVATYPLAFVLPFFVERRNGNLDNNTKYGFGYYLPNWLSWFQTPDNSVDGDQGWREEHMQWRFKLPAPLATYLGRVGWLWRNPAYGFGLEDLYKYERVVSRAGDPRVTDSPFLAGSFLVETQDGRLFQWRLVKVIPGTKLYVYINFGWNIRGLLANPEPAYTATFAFSVRFKSL